MFPEVFLGAEYDRDIQNWAKFRGYGVKGGGGPTRKMKFRLPGFQLRRRLGLFTFIRNGLVGAGVADIVPGDCSNEAKEMGESGTALSMAESPPPELSRSFLPVVSSAISPNVTVFDSNSLQPQRKKIFCIEVNVQKEKRFILPSLFKSN